MRDAAEWLGAAHYDMDAGKAMLQTGRLLTVPFCCQQTIEKALKAVIQRNCVGDEHPPKIHSLPKLAAHARLHNDMTDAQKDFIADISALYIETRYPETAASVAARLTVRTRALMADETEALLCWIEARL